MSLKGEQDLENNEKNREVFVQDSEPEGKLHFSVAEERAYYLSFKNQLIKLLYIIEDEFKGKASAELFFCGLMFELRSANVLCHNKLTKVCVKMFGLYNDFAYRNMTHDDIKKQIFECKGIVEYLVKQLPANI